MEEIECLKQEIAWLKNELQNELKRQRDHYEELLEEKEMECAQLRDELNNLRGREY